MTNQRDSYYMQQVLDLAQKALDAGEAPFASLIVKDNSVLVESVNLVNKTRNANRHSEIIALEHAQEKLGGSTLEGCTLYTICEPCPMCSFMIRELKISRVVFALASPHMGGFSRWPILQDEKISVYDHFGTPPEVVSGILADKALPLFEKVGYEDMFLSYDEVLKKHGKR